MYLYIKAAVALNAAEEAKFIINPYTPVPLIVINSIKATIKEITIPDTGPYIRAAIVIKVSFASKVKNITGILKINVTPYASAANIAIPTSFLVSYDFVFLFISLFAMNFVALAGNDKPIQVSEMPKAAQLFIKNHFADLSVAMAKVETDFLDKNYDVVFTNGNKVEFDKKGNWTNVDCEHTQVPVAILPEAIRQYVAKNYPDAKVLKIEVTDRKGYDVELSNGFELEFDKRMNVIDVDR